MYPYTAGVISVSETAPTFENKAEHGKIFPRLEAESFTTGEHIQIVTRAIDGTFEPDLLWESMMQPWVRQIV